MAFIMTLWIGNNAVLISSSQWQLKEFGKLNNSGHELFIYFRWYEWDLLVFCKQTSF